MENGMIIETERLVLRPFEAKDESIIYRIASDPDTTKYLFFWGRDGWTPEGDTQRFLYDHAIKEWQKPQIICREYAVIRKEDGAVMGDASIEWIADKTGEIGWILLPEYRGRGYIHEAGEALCEFGFEGLGMTRLIAHCDAKNISSKKVMERLGMHFEQCAVGARSMKNGICGDELTYALDKSSWWWKKHATSSYVKKTRQKLGKDLLVFAGACAFIYQDGKLLLQKRIDDGKWSTHGGCVEPGEDIQAAAAREVEEETGLISKTLDFIGTFGGEENFHTYPNGDMTWIIDTVFLCTSFEGEMKAQEEEVSKLHWFSIDNLPPQEDWEPNIYRYVSLCLKKIKEKQI